MNLHRTKQRHLACVATLTLSAFLIRMVFVWLKPGDAVSVDVRSWEMVAGILKAGGNPYEQTTVLNWPPVWPGIIYLLSLVSDVTGVSFRHALFILLSLLDCALATVVYLACCSIFGMQIRRAFWVSLVGISLSPILTLLSCQHGNFDVLPVLCILGGLLMLTRAIARHASSMWLAACFMLGIGGAVKTFPLFLAPLFIFSFPRPNRLVLLGAIAVIVAPWLLTVGCIYVASPEAVWRNVITYNSLPSSFGLNPAFKELFGASGRAVQTVCFLMLIVLAYATMLPIIRRDGQARTLFVAAAVILGSIPVFGPGFATQYILWIIPLWTILFSLLSPRRQVIVGACYVALTVCYLYLYAFVGLYGASVGPPELLITKPVLVVSVVSFGALLTFLLLGARLVKECKT